MHDQPLTATEIRKREAERLEGWAKAQSALIRPFIERTSKILLVPQKCQQQQKGGAKPPKTVAPPPPVRESNQQVAAQGETERAAAAKRKGLASTINPGSLLGNYETPGSRSLL